MLDIYLGLLDTDYYEAQFAFEGLADEHVWERPAPAVLSVGELAGHTSYWLAIRFAGDGEDLEKCKVKSPLIDARFRYFTTNLDSSPSEEHLALTSEQVWREMKRVYEETKEHFKASKPDLTGTLPGMPDWPMEEALKYTVFHVAYHVGQMYTVRHLLGETTPDN